MVLQLLMAISTNKRRSTQSGRRPRLFALLNIFDESLSRIFHCHLLPVYLAFRLRQVMRAMMNRQCRLPPVRPIREGWAERPSDSEKGKPDNICKSYRALEQQGVFRLQHLILEFSRFMKFSVKVCRSSEGTNSR